MGPGASFRRLDVPGFPGWSLDVHDSGVVFHLVHAQGPRRTITVCSLIGARLCGPKRSYRGRLTREQAHEMIDHVLGGV